MPESTAPRSLFHDDDVIPNLLAWRRSGLRCALVTLTDIDGAGPRPIGAQMAVAEDGRFSGYLSGGCLEHTIALAAQEVIRSGANKSIRFGKGSAYFDIKLPCGSGIELYFDQTLTVESLEQMSQWRDARQVYCRVTDLAAGTSSANALTTETLPPSQRIGNIFSRVTPPPPHVLLIGGGPALSAIASLLTAAGISLDCVTPDGDARQELAAFGITARAMATASQSFATLPDRFTAAIIAFHEHHWETDVLAGVLRTPCFYIGVMGSRSVHANRLAALTALGFSGNDLARLRGPIGLIPDAKSRLTLATGILAEFVLAAKTAGLLS